MSTVLLQTKLRRPSIPPKKVQRPHLSRRLNEGLESGREITLVSAPAGFGKTTCVAEWVSGLALPAAWLSLDPSDDDPARFVAYLVAALQKIAENLGQGIGSALRSGQLPSSEVISTTLINDILDFDGRFLLVLDDLQVIQDPFILQILEKLVANLPPPLHLVLLTREDPSLPLARLRANNQITEIRAADLRFTSREASRFLNEVLGLSLSEADIAVLEDRTEGWIVGLQLAGLSIRDRADPASFIASLSGSHRYILSYLTEQVLGRQPEEIQQFLLQTSILDKLSGDLCNAVTGRTDAHALLERLFTANLFLIPLDDEQRWYRYHHLFADLLSNRLRQTLPAQAIQALHCLAGDWLAQNDFLDEAIEHAVKGKDYERVASLAEQVARSMMFTGRINTLRNWLEALPDTSFHTHPRLSIYRIWIDLLQGRSDLSEQALQEQENLLQALPPSAENDQLRLELTVILCRFMAIVGIASRAIRLAEEALANLPEGDLASRARVNSALAIAYALEGRAEKAESAYQLCLRQAQAAENYSVAAHTIMVIAMRHYHQAHGRLHKAASAFQSIVDLRIQAGQKVFFPAGQGYIGLAGIHLEWHDLAAAEEYLTQGMELCRQGGLDGILAGWVTKSRLLQAKGDFEAALDEINRLEQTLPRSDHSPLARRILIHLAMGHPDEAARLAMPLLNILSDGSARLPRLFIEDIQAIVIRVLLAQGETVRALHLLDELQATAEPDGRLGRLIEVFLLRALALQKQLNGVVTPAVLRCFEHSLDLAAPEGYVVLFLEEGPALIPLLNAVAKNPGKPDRLKTYARKLLDAFPDRHFLPSPATGPAVLEEMIEPLSKRELEVLRLLAEDLTYEEVAQRLVVSLNTVRFHVRGLYGKLGVEKRAAALDRARSLRLL